MVVVFIASCVLVGYAWVLYPLLVFALHSRATQKKQIASPSDLPPVAILFSAHDEEVVIWRRLENLAALDYPADRMQILVGVDGGTDRTAEIARTWASTHNHVRVIVEEQNRGKMAMLKRLMAELPNRLDTDVSSSRSSTTALPLLVFTDANTMFAPDALRHLVAPFADPGVGGVCGRLVFESIPLSHARTMRKPDESTSTCGTEEPTYWNIETRLKMAESSLDSCLGANGAIYAIRGDAFTASIPDNTIVDDFIIGMKVRERGLRLVFEPAAVATEELPTSVDVEWQRRVRIGAGVYQALKLCGACLLPRFGVFAWMFWSHKVLRWFTPHILLVAMVSGGALAVSSFLEGFSVNESKVSTTLVGSASSFAALLGLLVMKASRNSNSAWAKPFRLIQYGLIIQAALFAGFLQFCRGNLRGNWTRTARQEPTRPVAKVVGTY